MTILQAIGALMLVALIIGPVFLSVAADDGWRGAIRKTMIACVVTAALMAWLVLSLYLLCGTP